jgi:hypothetical protein
LGDFYNEHGRAEIHGIIREDEKEVTLQHPLRATDSDEVGGAGLWKLLLIILIHP